MESAITIKDVITWFLCKKLSVKSGNEYPYYCGDCGNKFCEACSIKHCGPAKCDEDEVFNIGDDVKERNQITVSPNICLQFYPITLETKSI